MSKHDDLAVLTLKGCNAVISNSHLVYASGRHGSAYVNKDAVYPHTKDTSFLCNAIAEHFAQRVEDEGIEVVIAPAVGGVILSQWVAHYLTGIVGREILGVYADKETVSVKKNDSSAPITIYVGTESEIPFCYLQPGQALVIETGNYVIKRGYDKLIAGKKVLVVEDILTTGGSVKKTVEAVRAIGGEVAGVAALCNRGGVTAEDIGDVPELFSLVNITLESWEASECPLCAQGVPINTSVGKGKEFLSQQGK